MDSPAPSIEMPNVPVVFRGKKRKLYRQRPAEEENTSKADIAPELPGQQDNIPSKEQAPPQSEDGMSVAEIIRQRNARKSRLRGVGFGTDDALAGTFNADDELSLMIREESQKALDLSTGGVSKRFTAQTGLTGELVNKHMTKYIESEFAKRHSAVSPGGLTSLGPSSDTTSSNASVNQNVITQKPAGHIALQGKLMEIDLGDEVRSRNEALTDRARRLLNGENVGDEQQDGPTKKVRLGRDGKPWRPRNRRDSDAVKRDQLVEEILRENRLDVYETPTPPPVNAAGHDDDDGAADDRIAEEFRREFMDAMAQRQQKKKPVVPPGKPGAKKDEEVLKGPKLGGSRNSRAAMRDMLLKKEKEGKR
ncbi:hypothetical protein BJ170DRAFT_677304 [Xylariales sp. AK1849]|nr:hypothetical protein BJ170DRAFT_677304 [Xylariales sp. AK1849]